MDLPAHNRVSENVHLMPDGLQQLMSDISREVLRSQPENLYRFISDYLEELKKIRCLPHFFDKIDGNETFSSDTASSINSFEKFTTSSSEVVSYETFSSTSGDYDSEKSPCELSSEILQELEEQMEEEGEGEMTELDDEFLHLTKSVSTKDTLAVKADQMSSTMKEASVAFVEQAEEDEAEEEVEEGENEEEDPEGD